MMIFYSLLYSCVFTMSVMRPLEECRHIHDRTHYNSNMPTFLISSQCCQCILSFTRSHLRWSDWWIVSKRV